MAINQFLRLRNAKPSIEEGQQYKPFKPTKVPKTTPEPMPQILQGLMKPTKPSKRSAFYGD